MWRLQILKRGARGSRNATLLLPLDVGLHWKARLVISGEGGGSVGSVNEEAVSPFGMWRVCIDFLISEASAVLANISMSSSSTKSSSAILFDPAASSLVVFFNI